MSTNNESKSPGYDAKEYIEKFLSTESVGKVFDVMNLGAVLLARDFTVIYVNEAICRILAVSKDKIMNKNILSLFKKDEERELAKEILSLRTKGVSSRYEIKLTNGRNEEIYLLGSGNPIFDKEGTFVGTFAFYMDITKRKNMERELEQLKFFSEDIIESIPSGIVVIDEDLKVLSANRTFLNFLSLSRHEVVGTEITEILPFESLREKSFLKHILYVLSNGGMRTLEDIPLNIDSKNYIVTAKIKDLETSGGEGKKVLIILDDITTVRKLQKELIHVQRMDSIGRLAGGIAHDFNNLLGGILGYGSILMNELPEGTESRKNLEMIIQSAERAADLTRQLLTFSSSKEVRKEIFNPCRVVENIVKLLSRTINKNILIEMKLDPDTPHILGNETNFEQAILNLCINARDAMPEGGTLTIEAGTAEIDEAFCEEHIEAHPGRYTKIVVSDTGVGIEPEIRHRIFEPFFSTKESKEKAGLGLSIVYGTVKNMGGFIDIHSLPGNGTSFILYIPAQEEKEKERMKPVTSSSFEGNETILVVDDEEIMRDLSKRILSSAGYTVITAKGGGEALEKLEKTEKVDMVILDLIMPGMNGSEVFELIRKKRENLPIIVSTGYSPGGSAAELLKTPLTDFLQKPFYMKDMLSKVRTLLDEADEA